MAAAAGWTFREPALLGVGACFLLATLLGLASVLRKRRRVSLEVERPTRARVAEPSFVSLRVVARSAVRSVTIVDRTRPPSRGVSLHVAGISKEAPFFARTTEFHSRRGRIRTAPLHLGFADALDLARVESRHPKTHELVVWPALGELAPALRELAGVGLAADARACRVRRDGAETRNLRDYLPGDAPRRIHWKASARRGDLVVRDVENEDGGSLRLVLAGGESMAGPATKRRFENAVSLFATLLHAALEDGRRVLASAGACEDVVLEPGARTALAAFEDHLAELDPPLFLPELRELRRTDDAIPVLVVHPGGPMAPALPEQVIAIDAEAEVERGRFVPASTGAES